MGMMKLRLLYGLPIVATLGLAGCSEDFLTNWSGNFRNQLASASEEQVCGDGNALSALITDCPMPGVCFTEACSKHDTCYAFCERSQRQCDLSLYTDITAICHENIPFDDPRIRQCLYFALGYYAAVESYGDEFYPCDGQAPPPEFGACCTAGAAPQCTEGEVLQCTESSIAFPGQSCADLEELFGGCPTPPNDDCQQALEVCTGLSPAQGAGRCSGGSDDSLGDRVCQLASQNCQPGESCIPYDGHVFACSVVGDNRLATTDGAIVGTECVFDMPARFQADIWFAFVPPCTGTLSFSMCRGTDYDATLAVYGGASHSCACPEKAVAIPLACDDDSCGTYQTGALLSIQVLEGMCYLIRVGGWSSDFSLTGAARGLSQLEIGMLCE